MILSLAPMAGFTSAPFRLVCTSFGADLTYTEMVSAAGLAHGSIPTRYLLETLPQEKNVVCQLFGANPEELACAAREIEQIKNRFVALNLNAGCPMPKVVRVGAGASLLKDPEKLFQCLSAMRANSSLPISVKTRPGPAPDQRLLSELLDAAVRSQASCFILHARFTSQMHTGKTHLDLLAQLVSRSPIPIVGNGGVVDANTFQEMAQTGVQGVMIGRAALDRPWLFQELKMRETIQKSCVAWQDQAFEAQRELVKTFWTQLVQAFPQQSFPSQEKFIQMALRTHLFRYWKGRPNAAHLRKQLLGGECV